MENFYWIGERLWLEAVNSEFISDGQRTDGWHDTASLQNWLRQAASRHQEASALHEFTIDDDGDDLLKQAKNLRAALRLACETAHTSPSTQQVASEAVEAVNTALSYRGVILRIEHNSQGWHEQEVASGQSTDALWLLARSAARSWARGELARLKPCANPNCILWFLDTSKNGTRRWCSMEACGNRHKVATHHQRRKIGQAG